VCDRDLILNIGLCQKLIELVVCTCTHTHTALHGHFSGLTWLPMVLQRYPRKLETFGIGVFYYIGQTGSGSQTILSVLKVNSQNRQHKLTK